MFFLAHLRVRLFYNMYGSKYKCHWSRIASNSCLDAAHPFEHPVRGAKKKASRDACFFLSNPKDWYGITRRVYGIRRKATAWHTPCSLAVSTAARCALFRQRRNARGAICARSFTSELADSLRLLITRQRVFLLRIDCIQHFVLIPYRRQAADFIHAYRRDYIESYVEALDFGELFRFFRGKKQPPFTIAPFPRPFGLEGATCD